MRIHACTLLPLQGKKNAYLIFQLNCALFFWQMPFPLMKSSDGLIWDKYLNYLHRMNDKYDELSHS